MSVFIKFDRDEVSEIRERIKEIQNSLFNLNSSVILSRKDVREKMSLLHQGDLLVNEAHEELAKLAGFMPQMNEFSILKKDINKDLKPIGKDVNKDEALRKLKEKITNLK
jgi:cob(I)alamin adenosyltransferase